MDHEQEALRSPRQIDRRYVTKHDSSVMKPCNEVSLNSELQLIAVNWSTAIDPRLWRRLLGRHRALNQRRMLNGALQLDVVVEHELPRMGS